MKNLYSVGDNAYGEFGNNNTITSYKSSSVVGSYNFIQFCANSNRVLALRDDGTIWAWGNIEIPENLIFSLNSPRLIQNKMENCISITGGADHTLMLKSDGSIWSCGINTNGCLGYGNYDPLNLNNYSIQSVIGNNTYNKICAGMYISFALDINGYAWAWGKNDYGQLGNNSRTSYSSPISVLGGPYIDITCKTNGSAFLKSDGSVWESGVVYGNLVITSVSSPISVVGNHSFVKISGGGTFMMGLKSDGSIWTWGENTYGQLGNNNRGTNIYSPISVVGNYSFIEIATTAIGCAGLKSDGSIWTWGSNNVGQLGDNTLISRSSPVSVVGNHSFSHLIRGYTSNLYAMKSDGSVYGWGYNTNGQLGDGTYLNKYSPISIFGNNSFFSMGTSLESAYFITSNGNIYMCGDNKYGQFGVPGSKMIRSSPVMAPSHPLGLKFIKAICGPTTTGIFGLDELGNVYKYISTTEITSFSLVNMRQN